LALRLLREWVAENRFLLVLGVKKW